MPGQTIRHRLCDNDARPRTGSFSLPTPPQRRRLPLHRGAAFVAALCLLLRATVPAGYMPGDLLAGEWAVPCPSGFPAALFELAPDSGDAHDHHHSGHGAHADHGDHQGPTETTPHVTGLDDQCPLGEALQTPTLPTMAKTIAAAPTRPLRAPEWQARAMQSLLPGIPQARAPPQS